MLFLIHGKCFVPHQYIGYLSCSGYNIVLRQQLFICCDHKIFFSKLLFPRIDLFFPEVWLLCSFPRSIMSQLAVMLLTYAQFPQDICISVLGTLF